MLNFREFRPKMRFGKIWKISYLKDSNGYRVVKCIISNVTRFHMVTGLRTEGILHIRCWGNNVSNNKISQITTSNTSRTNYYICIYIKALSTTLRFTRRKKSREFAIHRHSCEKRRKKFAVNYSRNSRCNFFDANRTTRMVGNRWKKYEHK